MCEGASSAAAAATVSAEKIKIHLEDDDSGGAEGGIQV